MSHCKRAIWLLMLAAAVTYVGRPLPAQDDDVAASIVVEGGEEAAETVTSEAPPDEPSHSDIVLRLANGDFVAGQLGDTETANVIRWHSPLFTQPLQFPAGRVAAILFPLGVERPQPSGEFCFELSGGDQLFGDLVELTATDATVDVPRFGHVKIDRGHIRRVLSWGKGADVVYQGPTGLTGWDHSGDNARWDAEGGQLITANPNAFIQADLSLPAKCGIEFEMSWKEKADFVLAMGVDNDPKNIQQAFRIEVWENDLVLMRETDDEVDVVSLMKIKPGEGHVHLQVYLDQEKSRIFVYTADGRRLGDLEVSKGGEASLFTFTGLRLMNKRGDLRLERLRVTEWIGEAPHDAKGDAARAHMSDGTIVNGLVTSYDKAAKQFVIQSGDNEQTVPQAKIVSFTLPGPEAEDEDEERAIHAIFPDNNRISGTMTNITDGVATIERPGIAEPLKFPVAELHSLGSKEKSEPLAARKEREGRLQASGLHLRGYLIDSDASPGILVFHPREGISASPLVASASAKLIYRDPPPPQPVQTRQRRARVVRQRPAGFWGGVINQLSSGRSSVDPAIPAHRAIHLRTGDMVPATVTRIDEKGVHFKSNMTDATFIPNEKIKAVEFVKAQSTIRFSKEKRERLLTLPRMQKHNPPTHLIRSIKGDYLRGRIESMDDDYLTVEVRLNPKRIRREYISRIIWLHGENLDEDDDGAEEQAGDGAADNHAEADEAKMRVQTLRRDGSRLTFEPSGVAEGSVVGTSDVLGNCKVDVQIIDQLFIGDAIEEAAAKLTYHQWKLRHAVEPRFVSASGGENTGLESPLVGQQAPDFSLKLLEGGEFRLSNHRGEIIVLDFWATWCGPCMQTMPQVEEVIHDFEDKQVKLIAVNLSEDPERISATLERVKLAITVALDIDGAVADKYSATSIPQTVIIDREGKIVRVFVGGGPQFGETLRKQLDEVVTGKKPDADGEPADAQPADAQNPPQ